MKKFINIIIIISFFTSFISCEKQMDKDPIGLLTINQIDTVPTLETIESAVESSYQPLGTTLNAIISGWRWDLGTVFRNDIILQDIASHDMMKKWHPDGDQPWMDEIYKFSFTSENQAFNGIWTYDYEGISRTNIAINFLENPEIEQITGISNEHKKQLLSEALFLRAYYYFDLINNFGDVPLILKSPNSFNEALSVSVRKPATDVKAQITSDLSKAEALAKNIKYPNTAQKWRVSKGAILALEAKIALYNKDWSKVLNIINKLDALGFYHLNKEYFDSFDASKEFTDNEVIFAYDHRSNEIPKNSNGLRYVTGWGFFAPTKNFIDTFEPGDPRLLYTIDTTKKMSTKIIGSTTTLIDYGNKVYVRYADVLLWKAEAFIETGNYTDAIAIINQIRARARTSTPANGSVVPAGTLPNRPTSTDPSQIKKWLMHERRVELGFESQRFNDLKRWKTAKTVLRKLGINFQDYNYLYPIPQREISKSGGLITQNKGY